MRDSDIAILTVIVCTVLTLHAIHSDERRKEKDRRKSAVPYPGEERRKKARRNPSLYAYTRWVGRKILDKFK